MADSKVQIGQTNDFLEGVGVDTPAGMNLFREGVVISDPDVSGARAKITNSAPAADAYGLAVRVIGGVVVGSEVEIKNDTGNPIPVSGAVSVSNFPATQPVSGTVALDSATLSALETIQVGNFPATQAISAASLPLPSGAATAAKQLADNHQVTVSNFPVTQPVSGTVSVGNFPATQNVAGTLTVTASDLDVRNLSSSQDNVRAFDSTDSEYLRVATSVTAVGDTTLATPSAGKRIRLQWVYAINDPTASVATKMTIKLGTAVQYVAWAISKRQQLTGAVDAPLVLNLSAAGDVAVTVFYQEV